MQNTKYGKPQTIQMSYPAPYSQSWANTQPMKIGIDKMKNCESSQGNRKKQKPMCNCCWKRPKHPSQACNPFAPHLKYGLFPRKVSLREPLIKPPMSKKIFPLDELQRISMDKLIMDRKKVKKERHFSEAPLLTIRPIDKQYMRQLSLSEMTHMDIKPRQSSLPFSGTLSPRSRRLHTSKR